MAAQDTQKCCPPELNITDLRLDKTPSEQEVDLIADRAVWKSATKHLQGPLSEANEDIFRECYGNLVHTKEPAELMDYLIEDGILSSEQVQRVQAEKSTQDGMRHLLKIVWRSENGYYALIRAVCLSERKKTQHKGKES